MVMILQMGYKVDKPCREMREDSKEICCPFSPP